jgi:hypothetical protein
MDPPLSLSTRAEAFRSPSILTTTMAAVRRLGRDEEWDLPLVSDCALITHLNVEGGRNIQHHHEWAFLPVHVALSRATPDRD